MGFRRYWRIKPFNRIKTNQKAYNRKKVQPEEIEEEEAIQEVYFPYRRKSLEGHCPQCGSTDIRRVRRITGYFSTEDKMNDAKLAEIHNRVSHGSVEGRAVPKCKKCGNLILSKNHKCNLGD